MPLNNRNDPLSIIKIEIIVIPIGRFIFIRIFFNTWIYKYIIFKRFKSKIMTKKVQGYDTENASIRDRKLEVNYSFILL